MRQILFWLFFWPAGHPSPAQTHSNLARGPHMFYVFNVRFFFIPGVGQLFWPAGHPSPTQTHSNLARGPHMFYVFNVCFFSHSRGRPTCLARGPPESHSNPVRLGPRAAHVLCVNYWIFESNYLMLILQLVND